MGNKIALGSLFWVRLILLGRCSVSGLLLGWLGPGATGRFVGDIPGTRSGHFPPSHVSAFSCPWAGSYTGAAFWMQIPERVALAAAGGAGGSTREALPLLVGERGLYWLPFNLLFCFRLPILFVLFSLFWDPVCNFSLLHFSYMEALVDCSGFDFLRRLLVSQLLIALRRF